MRLPRRIAQWVKKRDPHYIFIRLVSLLTRYGITPRRAERRIEAGVRSLGALGAHPTFPTPGRVVDGNAGFFQSLQGTGAEFAVHGYDHLDFRDLSLAEAMHQLESASDTYRRNGLEVAGFRFPYLSRTEDLLATIPAGMFGYSSNRAIWWDVVPEDLAQGATTVFKNLREFYRAESSEEVVSCPRAADNLVEIPVSLPDDIQLFDGLKAGVTGVAGAWVDILHEIYRRGEIFVLMFHPELFDRCERPLASTLTAAAALRPAVWVTQLRDVSRWWREKSDFAVEEVPGPNSSLLHFRCSDRATVLARHVDTSDPGEPWYGGYRLLRSRSIELALNPRPFVGLLPGVSEDVASFLREQGYITVSGQQADQCATSLDATTVARLGTEVKLIDYIESQQTPLLRYWRWPDGNRSALCITGDLDALSLFDYASRLFAR